MEYDSYTGEVHSRITSPTCEDLGIPRDVTYEFLGTVESLRGRPDLVGIPMSSTGGSSLQAQGLTAQSLVLHNLKFEPDNPNNPFSPYCQIPLPNPFGSFDYPFEPAFIRKRNERERERVRCVNDGYAKLRQHLPFENREKRISKVETLRSAIRYIAHLRDVLDELDSKENTKGEEIKDDVKISKDTSKELKKSTEKSQKEVPKKRRLKFVDEKDENGNVPKSKLRKRSNVSNALS